MSSKVKRQIKFSDFKHILPRPLRFALFRKQLQLPSIEESGLIFKPAETEYEFRSAFKVLHDSYVEFNYMRPENNGLRITPYHLLPSTITLIVKKEDQVIGTVSIVRDNPLGLPMDKIFDLTAIRQSNSRIGEISGLAINKHFRGRKGEVLHLIMRYLWKFTQEYLNLEYFVCAVNPAMNELWESVYMFEPLPDTNRVGVYDFVNGAPAVGLLVPVTNVFPKWQMKYENQTAHRDLFNFIKKPFNKNEYHCPNPYYSIIRNPMKKEIRERFLADPDINPMAQLSLVDRVKAFCHLHNSSVMDLDFLGKSIGLKERSERYEVYCRLKGQTDSLISDISESGLKLAPTSWIGDKAPDFLSIQIGPEKLSRVRTKIQWRNSAGSTGHKIVDADRSWEDFISYLQSDADFGERKKVA
jgi:hypothetical protein